MTAIIRAALGGLVLLTVTACRQPEPPRKEGPSPRPETATTADPRPEETESRLPPRREPARYAWVVRTELVSQGAVDRVVRTALAARLNGLLVQVRGRGDAWHRAGLEPLAAPLRRDPTFDPLARLIAAAHAEGIAVHGWLNVGLVAGATGTLPAAHLARRHPKWLSRPAGIPLTAPVEDLRRLAARSERVEGVYAEPGNAAYRRHVATLVTRLLKTYALDGIHLDYVRHPGSGFGRNADTLARARDRGLRPSDGDARWHALLTDGITTLVRDVRDAVNRVAPAVRLTVAVLADPDEALRVHQDWRAWVRRGLVDAVMPMNYAEDRAVFQRRLSRALRCAPPSKLVMGVGAWRLGAGETGRRLGAIRAAGCDGFALFSLEGLRAVEGATRTVAGTDPGR